MHLLFLLYFAMNLALYSGGTPEQNERMNQEVFSAIQQLNPTILPFITIPKDKVSYATEWLENYSRPYTKLSFQPIIIDEPLNSDSLQTLQSTRVLFITGGNTFRFLHALKENSWFQHVLSFVNRGGLLVGFSAGAMLTTPSIELAGYPSYDPDENSVGLQDLRSLGLVKYEIFPHYDGSARLDDELRAYTLKKTSVVYALPDGSGMFIQGSKDQLFGNIVMFSNGEKMKITCEC